MDKIKVAVLNPTAISEAEKMMVCAARLTQSGHKVKDLEDFLALYDKSYTEKTVQTMTGLPHPTLRTSRAWETVPREITRARSTTCREA